MAKEQTVLERVDYVGRSIERTSRSVRNQLDHMDELEKYLTKDANVLALFRLHIKAIRNEMDSLSGPVKE